MNGDLRARLSAALLITLIVGLGLGGVALWPRAAAAEGGAYQERPTVEPGRPTVEPQPPDEEDGGEEDAPEDNATAEAPDATAEAPDATSDLPDATAEALDATAEATSDIEEAAPDATEAALDNAEAISAPTATPGSLPRAGGGLGLAALLTALGGAALVAGAALCRLAWRPD